MPAVTVKPVCRPVGVLAKGIAHQSGRDLLHSQVPAFVFFIAALTAPGTALAQTPKPPASTGETGSGQQSCVDVSVGQTPRYDCLNQQLGALAAQQHRGASSVDDAPYSATSPSNVTGQFNESATRNRLGDNFGHSVTPERAPYAPPTSAIPR